MSVFAQAAAALHAATAAVNGGTVTYTRYAADGSVVGTASVLATFGRSTLVEDDATVGRIEVQADDFIVMAADLIISSSVAVVPQAGDRVTVAAGLSRTAGTYELTNPPYSPSGPSGALVRLHAKYVGA